MTNNKSSLSIREILATSRPVSWINTAAPFIVGYLLATQNLALPGIIGFVYFLFSYNLLMYGVNDIYDYESDLKNPRKNSVEGGLLEKSKHGPMWYVIIAANIPFLLYFLVFYLFIQFFLNLLYFFNLWLIIQCTSFNKSDKK